MNKTNPSAMALMAAAAAARLGANAIAQVEATKGPKVDPIEARRAPVPAGYKRVYHGHIPHQGSKEIARRRRQQNKAELLKARTDLQALLGRFIGRLSTPEVREEIAGITHPMTFWQLLFIAVACVGCYCIGHHNGWNNGFSKAEAIWERALNQLHAAIDKIGEALEGPK